MKAKKLTFEEVAESRMDRLQEQITDLYFKRRGFKFPGYLLNFTANF